MHGKQMTDLEKVARVVVEAVDGEVLGERGGGGGGGVIPLGADRGALMEEKARKLTEEAEASRVMWCSVGVDE